ncbi:hypothetical protein [Thiomicrorhabdus cannonii]|uniref:hypothetical protein n=1 Tax=Thiomicrorhabdus cannonii TaxID=2748011 RepID=UPI0015C15B9E|nr:hypothetical protein [Thiomicrorhabdus cannonii]
MLIKFLGFLVGTIYLVFFWVGGPFSLYMLFFASAEQIRDWFFYMAIGAVLVTLLTLTYEKIAQSKDPLNPSQFMILPMGILATVLNFVVSYTASFWI